MALGIRDKPRVLQHQLHLSLLEDYEYAARNTIASSGE